MIDIQKMKEYAEETVKIIKELINKEILKVDLLSSIGCSENGDTIILRDLFNYEIQYSLSEVSYIFYDYLEGIGDMNKNAYNTVLSFKESKNYEENKNIFIKSLCRLREIEKSV